jgi:cobalamin biosynthetic protein CobC
LPDAAAEALACAAARRCYRIADAADVVPVAGSQAAIQWLPRLVPAPTTVAILAPTYGGHADAWAAAGHYVVPVPDLDAVPDDARVLIAVNPNNPDGRVLSPDLLAAWSERCLVIIDEAFADVAPALSAAPAAGEAGLVVLRSFGKFFGLAGLRLGFVATDPGLAGRLRQAQGPWPVSGPALAIAAAALADQAWIEATRSRLRQAAARLDQVLERSGLAVIGGTDLFRLAASDDVPAVFERCARAGILLRPFADERRWLRFGIPGADRDFARLAQALAAAPEETAPPARAGAQRLKR